MLARLAAGGHRVAILSNTDVDLWPILDAPRLGGFVEIAVAAFRHGVEKPSPRAFNLALGALGVEATGTWFVGDDLRDDCVASDALGPTPAASPASITSPPSPTCCDQARRGGFPDAGYAWIHRFEGITHRFPPHTRENDALRAPPNAWTVTFERRGKPVWGRRWKSSAPKG